MFFSFSSVCVCAQVLLSVKKFTLGLQRGSHQPYALLTLSNSSLEDKPFPHTLMAIHAEKLGDEKGWSTEANGTSCITPPYEQCFKASTESCKALHASSMADTVWT